MATLHRSALAAGSVAILFWGGTPAATAIAANELEPWLVGVARIQFAALLLLPLVVFQNWRLPEDLWSWSLLGISAIIGFGGSFIIQSIGIAQTSTAHAALLFSGAPVLTGLIAFILQQTWPKPTWWIGGLIAVLGEAYLILGSGRSDGIATVQGDLIVLASVFCISIGYVAGAQLSAVIGLLPTMGWSIILAALVTAPLSPQLIEASSSLLSANAIAAVAYLTVAATVISYAAWFWALDKGGAALVSPLQFAQPIVSLVLSVVLLSETLGANVGVATALILLGVVICRRSVHR